MTNTCLDNERKAKVMDREGQRREVFLVFRLQLGEEKLTKSKKGNFLERWEPDWVTLVINILHIINILKITMIMVKTISLLLLRMFELVGNPGGANKQRPCLGGFPTNGELWHISATSAMEI